VATRIAAEPIINPRLERLLLTEPAELNTPRRAAASRRGRRGPPSHG
jgi:hypothetical protein